MLRFQYKTSKQYNIDKKKDANMCLIRYETRLKFFIVLQADFIRNFLDFLRRILTLAHARECSVSRKQILFANLSNIEFLKSVIFHLYTQCSARTELAASFTSVFFKEFLHEDLPPSNENLRKIGLKDTKD